MEEIVQQAQSAAKHCETFALLDTLEFLERGGRVGKARALAGRVLGRKPLITVRDGEVQPMGTAGNRLKAMDKILKLARNYAPFEQVSVMYSTTEAEAQMLGNGLDEVMPEGEQPVLARFGPVSSTISPQAIRTAGAETLITGWRGTAWASGRATRGP